MPMPSMAAQHFRAIGVGVAAIHKPLPRGLVELNVTVTQFAAFSAMGISTCLLGLAFPQYGLIRCRFFFLLVSRFSWIVYVVLLGPLSIVLVDWLLECMTNGSAGERVLFMTITP